MRNWKIEDKMPGLLEELKDKEKRLRTHCHAFNCSNIYECPIHCECGRHLGTETALVWDAAENLDILLSIIPGLEMHEVVIRHDYLPDLMYDLIRIMDTSKYLSYARIVLAYHEDEHLQLFHVVIQTDEIVRDIVRSLKRSLYNTLTKEQYAQAFDVRKGGRK